MTKKLKLGDKAPDFNLKNQDNKNITSKDVNNGWLILYFYPKDDTPGCTTQACSLRDANDDLLDAGARVVGVSKDDTDSHQKFKAKHKLNFEILSDPMGKTIESYNSWGPKMFGRLGILRKTFIIDPEGIIRKIYGRATPAGHGPKVLADLKSLQDNQS